ncbi:MAG: molybdenum cofactor guanylyltransferase, partial [Thermocrispum sp.]
LPPEPEADVAVLAADLPGLSTSTVNGLRAARGHADGAVLVDATGRRQWLTGIWRAGSLRGALPADPAGASVRATLGGLDVVEVVAQPGEAADVDTPQDLALARGRPSQRSHR